MNISTSRSVAKCQPLGLCPCETVTQNLRFSKIYFIFSSTKNGHALRHAFILLLVRAATTYYSQDQQHKQLLRAREEHRVSIRSVTAVGPNYNGARYNPVEFISSRLLRPLLCRVLAYASQNAQVHQTKYVC